MRSILLSCLLVCCLVAGCGQQKYGRGYGVPGDIRWVAYTSDGNSTHYYEVTDTKVSKIGKLLGKVIDSQTTGKMAGWTADFHTNSTITVYSIPGIDPTMEVATDLGTGLVLKSVSTGTKRP